MTFRLPTEVMPERFARAVKASCDISTCYYPKCQCKVTPTQARKAILAWEADPDGEVGTKENG